MTGRLESRVAIITGASRGVGRAMALAFAHEGARVVVAAKSVEEKPNLPGTIHSVAREIEAIGGEALAVRCDVRDDEQIRAMVEATVARFGRVDVLINNAGALWWKDVIATPLSRFDLMIDVNVRASFACAQAVLPHMIDAGFGHIINCSPPINLSFLRGKTGYLITKYGMTMLAMGLAEEHREHNIAANALWPVTLVESFATKNFQLGTPKDWRKADILADAALEIVTTPPADLTGRALLDEDFLRERGVTDFTKYRVDPEHEPARLVSHETTDVGRVPGTSARKRGGDRADS